jgi:hypothetical protein
VVLNSRTRIDSPRREVVAATRSQHAVDERQCGARRATADRGGPFGRIHRDARAAMRAAARRMLHAILPAESSPIRGTPRAACARAKEAR